MLKTFKERAQEAEIIDDFDLAGTEIEQTFDSIEKVNIWLGGNQVFVDSLKKVLRHPNLRNKKKVLLHDLGCGSGDGLVSLAKWSQKEGRDIQFLGLDANPYVVQLARERTKDFTEINFKTQNIFAEDYSLKQVDAASFNLCLHHFESAEINGLLQKCKSEGVQAILINDLHRHWLAYYLFYLVCWVFRSPKIARLDGLLSIRKGFKRRELISMAEDIGAAYQLKWRWAFRWQFILFL
ncbi:MAG: methyltransferase domain-containing protein [Bacteroidota bacterium]